MIAFIRGKIAYKSPSKVVIDTQYIGYDVYISLQTYTELKDAEEVFLYTYLQVKEDSQTLFGFYDYEEKKLFETLITVSGVGANTARLMLSSMNTSEIRNALLSGDVPKLTSIKGVGAKTAQRLVLELRDKVAKMTDNQNLPATTALAATSAPSHYQEALDALMQLGLSRNSADGALQKVLKAEPETSSSEDLIKKALQYT